MAADIDLIGGVLEVSGTDASEQIVIEYQAPTNAGSNLSATVTNLETGEVTSEVFSVLDVNSIKVEAGDGDDEVTNSTSLSMTAYGEGGNDMVRGGSGDDFLHGGEGADELDGKEGFDEISGDDGDDVLHGGNVEGDTVGNIMWGGDGDDEINGADGDDLLVGGEGDDTIRAFGGDDRVWGGLGNDDLRGYDGNDVIRSLPKTSQFA